MAIHRLFRFSPRSFGINNCGICSVNGTGSCPNNSVFPRPYNCTNARHSSSCTGFCYRKRRRTKTGNIKYFLGNGEAFCRTVLYLSFFLSVKGWAYIDLCFGKYIHICVYTHVLNTNEEEPN